MYQRFVRPLLFRLDAEYAHNLTITGCDVASRIPGVGGLAERMLAAPADPRLAVDAAGLQCANPLGLAAGFDKNGRAAPMLGHLGFGHVEIGSVSAYPSIGNARPRLFRLPDDDAVVVYYGVPNDGADAVAARLRKRRPRIPLGVNLVKTNDPARPAVAPDVYDDMAASMRAFAGIADYFALNLSCPNSAADRDFFDDLPRIDELLHALRAAQPGVPVFLKLKPTTDAGVIREIVRIADGHPFVRGFAINLPPGKPAFLRLSAPATVLERMPGAVSGRPVEDFVNSVLALLYDAVGPASRYTLIAAGGVFDAAGAYRKIRLGASLVQVYTALIFRGPALVARVTSELVELLDRDGHESITNAVGSAYVAD